MVRCRLLACSECKTLDSDVQSTLEEHKHGHTLAGQKYLLRPQTMSKYAFKDRHLICGIQSSVLSNLTAQTASFGALEGGCRRREAPLGCCRMDCQPEQIHRRAEVSSWAAAHTRGRPALPVGRAGTGETPSTSKQAQCAHTFLYAGFCSCD